MNQRKITKTSLTRRGVLSGAAAMGLSTVVRAQQPAEVKVGLIVPLSGIYTRPGQVMRMGAEMGIEHINAQGGIKALGGAKLKLVVIDCGDTTEKAKNAAHGGAGNRSRRRDRRLSFLLHARRHRSDRARRIAGADAVLFRSSDRTRLQIHLPHRGTSEPAIRARPA